MYPAPTTDYRLARPLPALSTSAHAYALKAVDTGQAIPRVARALGASTSDVHVDSGPGQPWRLGDGSVSVSSGCAVAGPATIVPTTATPPDAPSAATTDTTIDAKPPAPSCPAPQRPAGLPTEAAATTIARTTFEKLGLDLTGVTVEVSDAFSSWFGSVAPRVDGRTAYGWTWTVSIGPNGAIQSATGYLAHPDEADEYPLIGVSAGFDRLKAETVTPMLAIACPANADCPTPQPVVRTVTGARLGLVFAPWADGQGAVLVPAYGFTIDDGSTIPVVALPDRYLTPPAADSTPPASASGGEPTVR